MRTEEEQNKWDLQCYGCSREELNDMVLHSIGDPFMLVASILSDAQHVIGPEGPGDVELGRQFINRAKKIIFDLKKISDEVASH